MTHGPPAPVEQDNACAGYTTHPFGFKGKFLTQAAW